MHGWRRSPSGSAGRSGVSRSSSSMHSPAAAGVSRSAGQLAIGHCDAAARLPAGLPLLFVLPMLYPWMHPEIAAHLDNRFYLNAPFFYVRWLFYAIVWLGLGFWVLRALSAEDSEAILYRLAPPGLILLALSVTFSAIDFTLSMDPHFKSSIYGMLIGCESVLLALSVAVMGLAWRAARKVRRSIAISGDCCSHFWCSGPI